MVQQSKRQLHYYYDQQECHFNEGSTDESGNTIDENQRTVKAQSLVICKKVQNSTGINQIDMDQDGVTEQRKFPVKVIYVKPNRTKSNDNKENKQDNQNISNQNQTNTKTLRLKKDFIKQNGIDNQEKLREQKYRPKSATSQQIKKNQVQHSKLGANSDVKPQVSYVKKVVKSQQRPQTSKPKLNIQKKNEEEKVVSPKKEVEIPFTQNRFQGQFQNMTKDLCKKAQEQLMTQKQEEQKQKEEMQQKKEKQKQIAEEIKKKNQEALQKQKEKGIQRVDPKEKQEEKKKEILRQEHQQEVLKKKEARQKRKEEGRKQLGLDMFKDDQMEEYRNKVKQDFQKQQEQSQQQIKIQRTPTADQSNGLLKKQNFAQRAQSAFNNKNYKDMIKEQQKLDDAEEENKERDKKQILKEMQAKRKQQLQEQKKLEQEKEQKKQENLKSLDEQLRKQKEEYYRRKEQEAKIKEEREKIQQDLEKQDKKQSKKNKKFKNKNQESKNHQQQLSDLRDWIEDQMRQEELNTNEEGQEIIGDNQNVKPQIQVQFEKKTEQTENQDGSVQEVKKYNNAKLLKHKLPGNHLLAEKEESKLGARQNRYGVYGDNGYGKVVEIQREKSSKPQQKQNQNQKDSQSLNKKDKKKVKDHLKSKVKEISKKVDLEIADSEILKEQDNDKSNEEDLKLIDDIDLEPTKQEKSQEQQRAIINQEAKDQNDQLYKRKYEQKKSFTNSDLPGILNTVKELRRQEQEQQDKETKATRVIQKWTRGFLARQQVRQMKDLQARNIEEEYGYFEDQVKFNSDYNLQKFLKDKQRLREKNKTSTIKESNDIVEKIGEHSSSNNYKISSSQAKSDQPVLLQNFFKQKPDHDPLSIISIYAKKHAAPKIDYKNSPRKQQQEKGHQQQKYKQKQIQEDDEIEEEIYSESFEEAKSTDKDIEEDIIASKEQQSSESFQKKPQKQVFEYSMKSPGSIQEDIMMSGDKKSKKSESQSSIIDEIPSASRQSNSHRKNGSVIEESIEESIEYQKYEFDSYQESQSKKDDHGKKEIEEFKQKYEQDRQQRKKVVNELLSEMQRYEQAHISQAVVDRLEKVMTQSLAQKDQILLAQRLHELDQDKKHKDEINKIREEQVKLMSQFILMGGNNQSMTERQRKEMVDNIQKAFNKPLDDLDNKYEEKKSKGFARQKEENNETDDIEESKTLQKLHNNNQRKGTDESIEEDIPEDVPSQSQQSEEEIKESVYVEGKKQTENNLSMARMALGSEESVRQQAKKTLNGSNKKDKNKNTVNFAKNSFEEFSHEQFKKVMLDQKAIGDYLDKVTNALDTKLEKENKKLKTELNRELISPRTYDKKNKELEKWVTKEKNELTAKKQRMLQTCEELGSYLNKLNEEKKIMLEKIGSPRHSKRLLDSQSSVSLDYDDIEEESNESIREREARSQLQKISRHAEQEQFNHDAQRKKAAAKKLIEQKEKSIQDGIKQKRYLLEKEYADELLNEALQIDVEKEIENRLKQSAKHIEESYQTVTDQYESSRSLEESKRSKKRVNFASPPKEVQDKFSSLQSQSDSAASSKLKSSSQKFEESIGESIKVEDSNNLQPPSSNQNETSKKTIQSDGIKESIQEEDSSNYSEDFISQSQLSESANKTQQFSSKNKLQDKADQIEEQNDIGYSMDFEEESMGKNQTIQSQSKSQNVIEKVEEEQQEEDEEIVEESANFKSSSQMIQSKESQANYEEQVEGSSSIQASQRVIQQAQNISEHSQSQSQSESEDKEVVQSSRSIEWKYELQIKDEKKDSIQITDQNHDEEEDDYSADFEEEPIYSKREQEESEQELSEQKQQEMDDMNDLQSFPEDIEESFEEFQNQADRITDEILDLALQELKQSEGFQIQSDHIDEDQFKNVYPYTLENAPEPVQVEVVQSDDQILQNQQPIQVEIKHTENKEEEEKEKYEQNQQQIQQHINSLERYLDYIIESINRDELVTSLEKPIDVDPAKILARIQVFENEDGQSQNNNLNESTNVHSNTVLPLEFFLEIEEKYIDNDNKDNEQTETSRQRGQENENIYHKAIFDAVNDALDAERPYKKNGQPTPWSKQTRVIKNKITKNEVERILYRCKQKIMSSARIGAGTRFAPLPPPPPPQNDYDSQPQQQIQPEEVRRNNLREEKLGELLTKEIEENDNQWINYEMEDLQVKIDLADMVLEHLADEVSEFIQQKQQ